ncbi:GNAT family N-acetyltransferase [Tabrizicola sp.]|jgi:GNAT superfamily N-acetyltransferase|uniref:GNAT family N-acetyltransferase n=1 Tax=Tabrizicola sp. TaxID=2005166 RepID=UPI001A45BF19|nr:GNAT family N-acetyltransferase [Tabrizicola sp.]MBL9073018.1 GNAT family N-acetyltransferase [Tabrizicola sp.]
MPTPNTPPVAVRLAGPEDLPEVHRMLIALSAQHGVPTTVTPRLLARIALEGRAARLLVALRPDSPQRHPVGFALMLMGRNMVAGADWGVVEQVYVQEPDRKRGIGRALVAAARAEAAEAGCEGVTVSSRPVTDGSALAWRAQGLDLSEPEPRFAAA